MRFRFSILLGAGALIGFPGLVVGQSPETKPDHGTPVTADPAIQYGAWAYQLSTPANAKLLTWSRFLGADLADADAPLRSQLKLNDGEGVVVTNVKPDGAAAESGLAIHDVLVGLADEPKPESTYPMFVWRRGDKKPLTVKLKSERQGWIGVHLAEIDDAMRTQLSLPAGRGLLVQQVTDDSPAKQAGLQLHDVIDGWSDGTPSGTVEEFSKIVRQSEGKALAVQVLRHGKSLAIHFTPQKRPEQAAASAEIPAAHLLWLGRVQQQMQWQIQPQLRALSLVDYANSAQAAQLAAARAALATGDNPQAKLSRVENQLDQLLKELQSARQTIEEIRKLEQRKKDKTPENKK